MERDVRRQLNAAMTAVSEGFPAANQLCVACVDFLGVDGAAISLIDHGASRGTYGSSGALSRRIDEMQFTFGEGPCLEAVQIGLPVLVPNLADSADTRWPAFSPRMLESGMQAVFAFPVCIDAVPVGALDLFRAQPGPLSADEFGGGLWAAELAAHVTASATDEVAAAHNAQGWERLPFLDRTEVHQATGILIAKLDIDAAQALMRIRAHAFAVGRTASEVALDIVEHRLVLESDSDTAPPTSGSAGFR